MTFENMGRGALDYLSCRYGRSKLMFRGPARKLDKPYVAFLGGTETYGKFLKHPYSDLVEQDLLTTCVNLGCINAGPDVFLNDPFVPQACSNARLTVIEVMGCSNLSNRFYSVHPRRNDRFLKASNLMQTIFRDIDFTEFSFTRHLLSKLKSHSPERYAIVEAELKEAWVARMQALTSQIDGKVVLLWASERPLDVPANTGVGLGHDPLFVDADMLDQMRPHVTDVVEFTPSPQAQANKMDGMFVTDVERPAGEEMLGQEAHAELAEQLVDRLAPLL